MTDNAIRLSLHLDPVEAFGQFFACCKKATNLQVTALAIAAIGRLSIAVISWHRSLKRIYMSVYVLCDRESNGKLDLDTLLNTSLKSISIRSGYQTSPAGRPR